MTSIRSWRTASSRGSPLGGEPDTAPAAVLRVGAERDERVALESAQEATQVARVQSQAGTQLLDGARLGADLEDGETLSALHLALLARG